MDEIDAGYASLCLWPEDALFFFFPAVLDVQIADDDVADGATGGDPGCSFFRNVERILEKAAESGQSSHYLTEGQMSIALSILEYSLEDSGWVLPGNRRPREALVRTLRRLRGSDNM